MRISLLNHYKKVKTFGKISWLHEFISFTISYTIDNFSKYNDTKSFLWLAEYFFYPTVPEKGFHIRV